MNIRLAFHMPNSAETGHSGLLTAASFLQQNLDLAKSPATSVNIRVMESGALPAEASFEVACSELLSCQNTPAIVSAIMDSEARGYDAAIIGCAHDPGLKEARQSVNIPVIGLTQAAVLYAHMMGTNYGIVSISPQARLIVRERIANYGLSEHLVGIAVLKSTLAEQAVAWLDTSAAAIEDFRTAARELIALGAEVIYPACGASSLMLRTTPGLNAYPGGITEIDGVPIVDQLSVAVKMAEMLVDLRRAGSTWISRACGYAQPTAAVIKQSGFARSSIGAIWTA